MSHYGVDLHHNCFNYYKIDEDKPIARKKIYLNDETGMNDSYFPQVKNAIFLYFNQDIFKMFDTAARKIDKLL